MALSPMRIEATATSGVQRTGSLTLANDARAAARFRTEILDLSIDSEAVPQFEKDILAEAAFSCKQWLTVNPMEGDMLPSTQVPVRYTFRIPADLPARTYHCAIGFTSLPDVKSPQTSAMGIVAQLRLTCTFYITIGKPEPSGEVEEITLERLDKLKPALQRVVFSVRNAGQTNLRGAGVVEVLGETEEVVQTLPFPPVVIFPDRTQRIPLVLQSGLPDGNYKVRARVNLGTGEIQEAILAFRLTEAP